MDNPVLALLVGSSAPPVPLPANASYQLRYETWLRHNHKWLLPILDTARSLTLFLPGRFQEGASQLRSEGIYTALNVISVYHDYLLDTPRALTAELRVDPQGKKHTYLKLCQGVLLFAHYTEVFAEMASKRIFADTRPENEGAQTRASWMCIAAVEGIKAYCRLSMLYANRGRMLTPPSQEEIVLDHMSSIRAKQKVEMMHRERREWEEQEKQRTQESQRLAPPLIDEEMGGIAPYAPRTALISSSASSSSSTTLSASALPPNSSFAPHASSSGHLAPLHIQSLIDLYVAHGRSSSPESKLGRPHGRFVTPVPHEHENTRYTPPVQHVVSEILHIVRPVIYTLARAECAGKQDSWTPFILSLAVDAASRTLAPSISSLSRAEFDEVQTRIRGYFFYFLRDPLFAKVVAGPLQRIAVMLSRIPLIGTFLSSIISIIFTIQKYYFYTSAS